MRDRFYRDVAPLRPNEWELDEALEHLLLLPVDDRRQLLEYVRVIWPISHSLCFSFLEHGGPYLLRYGGEELAEWVRQLLACYEREGLRGARAFMVDSVAGAAAGSGASLESLRGRLLPFLRGISGMQLELQGSLTAWTDSATIYLPDEVSLLPERPDNERLYVFLACCQWGYLNLGTFADRLTSMSGLVEATDDVIMAPTPAAEIACRGYGDPQLAASLLHYLEFGRVLQLLQRELPGLMRLVRPLLERLVRSPTGGLASRADNRFRPLLLKTLEEVMTESGPGKEPTAGEDSLAASLDRLALLYPRFAPEHAGHWREWLQLTGRLDFSAVQERVMKRRAEERLAAVRQLAKVITRASEPRLKDDDQPSEQGNAAEKADGATLMVELQADRHRDGGHELRLNNTTVDLPAELSELLTMIARDLGQVPEGYVQAAVGIAGNSLAAGESDGGDDERPQIQAEGIFYDEWDFRRRGYRHQWCTLIEKELHPVRSQFIEDTLHRYRGLLGRMRRQFESLRTQHRFVRRRRDGDDLDVDALIEAAGDRAAGVAPTERLFVRLLRDTRDIGVMFLVDMSNSTEGWVGRAIKESLVLLGDLLEVVGDRYAIYGFSGMRRSRCELYPIKGIGEPFGELVQQRICAISPREYTRMATPIRHLTSLLQRVDARIRLLIVISDGKPEDYDDYKGDYAVEDTRQALIEARSKGVIPFCITIDRAPHAYLPHMFGRGNYVFVDSVGKLPQRLPEIYRLLTS